jgi:uncharacterized membrane protein
MGSSPAKVSPVLRNSYDLILLIALAVLVPALPLLPSLVRVPLGLAMVLLAPGYALAAAVFPRHRDLEGMARAALSFGLSISLLPLLALLLSLLPWGIRPLPIAISLSLSVLLFGSIALWRRRSLAPEELAHVPALAAPVAWWLGMSRHVKARYITGTMMVGALLTAGAVLLPASGPEAEPTQFYVLGQQGLAENYPRQAELGEELTLTMGIVSREAEETAYTVQVWAHDALNSERRVLVTEAGPFRLLPGTSAAVPISWYMPWTGNDQKVELLLLKADQPVPYRQLWLWLNVVEGR